MLHNERPEPFKVQTTEVTLNVYSCVTWNLEALVRNRETRFNNINARAVRRNLRVTEQEAIGNNEEALHYANLRSRKANSTQLPQQHKHIACHLIGYAVTLIANCP